MAEYEGALKEGKEDEVESYAPMQHGWMVARADFQKKETLKEFERGYKKLVTSFWEASLTVFRARETKKDHKYEHSPSGFA